VPTPGAPAISGAFEPFRETPSSSSNWRVSVVVVMRIRKS
jgi:hypothetical protein